MPKLLEVSTNTTNAKTYINLDQVLFVQLDHNSAVFEFLSKDARITLNDLLPEAYEKLRAMFGKLN